MPRQPLFPHVPKRRTPLYSHRGEAVPPQYRDIISPSWPEVLLPQIEPTPGETKIHAVMKRLKDGVERIQDSHEFRIFLTTMAKFHEYSWNNQLLIMLQRPDATKVAGFVTWKELGRWVKKGEHGITILAPGFPPKAKPEEPEEEEKEIWRVPVYFFPVAVFDISQTEGKPLPEFDVPVLTGEANEELFVKLKILMKQRGVAVNFEPRPLVDPGIKGQFTPPNQIWVRPEEPPAQQLKTLLHESAHYYSAGVFRIPRADAETIAESSAYVVGAHYGFDTGVRSFPYVALWAKDKKVLNANLEAIRKVATTMLEGLEKT